MDPESADRIAHLAREELDWPRVIRQASLHGVSSLLHRRLDSIAAQAVPEDTRARLQNLFLLNVAHNHLLVNELFVLLDLFEANGISAVSLKGPGLAARAYGDLSLRSSRDLDILVRERDAPRATRLLISTGYELVAGVQQQDVEQILDKRIDKGVDLVRADPKIYVELHWALLEKRYAFHFDPERAREQLDSVTLDGRSLRTLSVEHTLLYLCAHGARHNWESLKWICDFAHFIHSHPQIAWDDVLEASRKLHARRRLLLGARLASDVLGLSPADPVRQAIRQDPTVGTLATQIREELFTESKTLQRVSFSLKLLEKTGDKLWFLVTPGIHDRGLLRLPPALNFLHYVVRPVRLVREYGSMQLRGLLRRLRRR